MMVKDLEEAVVRFSGDSGDGMQLAGNIFSTVSATVGNDISTFPDYPADIRAPQGSLTGVSGFQVHIGAKKVYTPGDLCDVLVAMNAAAADFSIFPAISIFVTNLHISITMSSSPASSIRTFSIRPPMLSTSLRRYPPMALVWFAMDCICVSEILSSCTIQTISFLSGS